MPDIVDRTGLKQRLGESLSRPETVIALIVTCGFLVNVQQGTDTNAILRDDPLVFKGIRVLTILLGGALAIFTVVKRKIPCAVCLAGLMLPFTLYFCTCILSIPYSAYPLLSLFKVCELGLVVLVCLIGITSVGGTPSDFFHLNVKIVLLYLILIWGESFLFPSLAWVPLRGEMPLFGHALSGVFPVINGNTVGLFGAVLVLAYLPKLFDPPLLRLRHALPALLGLASVVCSYSRISLFGLAFAALVALVLLRQYAVLWGLFLCLLLLATSGKVRTLTMEHLARGQEDRSLDGFASHRLAMWDHVVSDYRASVVGRGYAAGFRYEDDLTTGHAHNSLVEVYFNVGLLGVVTWLFFMGAAGSHLYRRLKTQTAADGELVSIVGVTIFLLIKAMGSTVFVYLDASMLILAGIIIYLVRPHAATAPDGLTASEECDPSVSYL